MSLMLVPGQPPRLLGAEIAAIGATALAAIVALPTVAFVTLNFRTAEGSFDHFVGQPHQVG
jgi:hypothetical protein